MAGEWNSNPKFFTMVDSLSGSGTHILSPGFWGAVDSVTDADRSKLNQFCPVPFAKQRFVEESAKGPPIKDKRSEDYPKLFWLCFSSLSLDTCFECVINALWFISATYLLLLAEMKWPSLPRCFFFFFCMWAGVERIVQLWIVLLNILSDSHFVGSLNGKLFYFFLAHIGAIG